MPIPTSESSVSTTDARLQTLTQLIAEMGGCVERQFAEAIDALITRDHDLAKRVVLFDRTIDELQRDIEQRTMKTMASGEVEAIELRDVVAALRIANELERIGDLAKNVSRRVTTLTCENMPRKAMRGVKHAANLAQEQLRDVLDSFARRDVAMAFAVWNRDEEIDALYTSLFRELLTYMMEDPESVTLGIHLLFCVKNIERIGDHATNIAEAVCYMVQGHSFADERPKADRTAEIIVEITH
jgi:phosphate transport system protein